MKEIVPWLLRIQLTVIWLNLTMANQIVINSLKAKKIESPQMNFVFEKKLIKFSCTYQPLSFCKIFIKKIFELSMCAIFGAKTAHLSWTIFFYINHCYYFHLRMAFFVVQNLKEILQSIQNYDDALFFGPKWSIYLKYFFFFQKTC